MDAPDGLSQKDGDVHGLDLVALELLEVVGYRVGHNNLEWRQRTPLEMPASFGVIKKYMDKTESNISKWLNAH